MTVTVSHDLAEAVTDPSDDQLDTHSQAWLDDCGNEIADIPEILRSHGMLADSEFWDRLARDSRADWVQKVWRQKSRRIAAFPAQEE
jgi:hypothetical protein